MPDVQWPCEIGNCFDGFRGTLIGDVARIRVESDQQAVIPMY